MAKRKALEDECSDTMIIPHNNLVANAPAAMACGSGALGQTPTKIRRGDAQNYTGGGGGVGGNINSASNTSGDVAARSFAAEKRKKLSTNFSELSQMGDFLNQTTNASQSQSKKNPAQLPRAGIIERISLKNFKCHSSLEFSLHQYINFILGRNGSGKSAVMDAIILCLGGKATCTGRQASAKTFIKTNCDRAELSITIKNEGEEAYRPQTYGSRITVERKISRDGQSQYRLLNEWHKLVTVKKQELDNIVEQFNIQVDNPVCFLNQETSKHFLNSSNKADKYKLFMKASQLDSMRRLQEQIEEERKLSEDMLVEKEQYMPKLEEELFHWENKYKKCQSVEKLKKKQSVLWQEYTWSLVANMERTLEATVRDKRQQAKSHEKHESKVAESQQALDAACDEHRQVEARITGVNAAIKELQRDSEGVHASYKAVSGKYRAVDAECKRFRAQIEKKTRDKAQLVSKLSEEKRHMCVDHEAEKRQKEQRVDELRAKQRELAAQERAHAHEQQTLQAALEAAARHHDERLFEIKSTETLVRNLQTDIEKLRNAAKNQIYRFGDFMVGLCEDVRRHYEAHKFRELPRGPVGMNLEPRRAEWSLAIEQCLGPLINAFICGNYEDERLLHTLIRKHVPHVNKRPRVIVTDFAAPAYDADQYRPDRARYPHPTVYEMLSIRDPVVSNMLLDQRRIESVLLLADRRVGAEVIERQSSAACSEAFLPNGDQLQGLPSFRMYACRHAAPYYFVENTDASIEQKQREIAKLSQSLVATRADTQALADQLAAQRAAKQRADRALDGLKRELFQLGIRLKDAESMHIPEPTDLAIFEDEIGRLDDECDELRRQLDTVQEDSHELRAKFEATRADLDACEQKMKVELSSVEELKMQFTQAEQIKRRHKEAVVHYKKLLDDLRAKETDIDKMCEVQQAELAKLVKAAEEMSPRLDTRKPTKSIETEIQLIEKQIKMTEKLHGDEEEITRKYKEMRDKFSRIKENIKRQKSFLASLKKALLDRENKAITFTHSKALRCAMDFTNYLNSRNYKGNLMFDHERQELDIIVQPNKSKDAKDAKDLKSLSGGERSFSTVAFLLSLWCIVESPILFLDEFDVFMDQINRNFAMELILSAAKDKLNGQYIFLTPQETGSVKADQYVKMFKMPDPKRAIDAPNDDKEND